MYFAKTDRLHEMEKLMSGIPNFSPRGQGKTVLQCEIDSCMKGQPPPDNYADVLKATMIAIHHQPFLERLESLIKESESETVMYRNEKHQRVFEESIGKCDEKNYAFLSAVYLMTADFKLWQKVKHYIGKNDIDFENAKLNGIHANGYALYCVAKDLYLGTKHLTVCDLADTELIPNKMFTLICNAMAIRRFGMKAIQLKERSESEC